MTTSIASEKSKLRIPGRRIFLKILTRDDVDERYQGWMNDEAIVRYTAAHGQLYTLEGLKSYVQFRLENPNDYLFGIFLNDNNLYIGNIKLTVKPAELSGDVGIIIGDKTVWGKGYATEAVQLVTAFAFETLNLDFVWAGMKKANPGSLKAFKKAGYKIKAYLSAEQEKHPDTDWVELFKKDYMKSKLANTGVHLWNKAKSIIPGGNQLLSKRAEMFLPEKWPAYFKKAKGVEVWDLDDRRYIDMSIMGIGACILGYAHPDVNRKVKEAIDNGNACTLNSHEEVELAEKLIDLHPWAQMARFARSGGEANGIAVRIARAHSGKDKIAFCGYHGWQDWYLAANLADTKNLDGQLLPGLAPAGVPRALKNTAIPFNYGKAEELKEIVKKNKDDVGVIVMEVGRYKKVDVEFLKVARQIADDIKAVLIFDEISSGFRVHCGGMHMLYGVNPDIAVLGKAIGNGFPITAVIGRRDVMQAAQDSFISSTFWTERTGFVAALETIHQYQINHVAQHIVNMGNYLTDGLLKIFKDKGLNIEIVGLPSVPVIAIKEKDPLVVKTVFTQEMLKRGYLATNITYVTLAHTAPIIDEYLKHASEVFALIANAVKENRLNDLLEGPVCHGGFSRLN